MACRPDRPWRDIDRQAVHLVQVRDGGRCIVCGSVAMKHPHHVVPRSRGGCDVADNLAMLCHRHHTGAHSGRVSRVELRRRLGELYEFDYGELE